MVSDLDIKDDERPEDANAGEGFKDETHKAGNDLADDAELSADDEDEGEEEVGAPTPSEGDDGDYEDEAGPGDLGEDVEVPEGDDEEVPGDLTGEGDAGDEAEAEA